MSVLWLGMRQAAAWLSPMSGAYAIPRTPSALTH